MNWQQKCAINTPKGTKVVDVAWFSSQRWEQVKAQYESPIAPEICVEILSLSNSKIEINTNKRLYFAAGAKEVWTCDEQGKLAFWNQTGKLDQSKLAHSFLERID
jgi:Uma2 family endonuclease